MELKGFIDDSKCCLSSGKFKKLHYEKEDDELLEMIEKKVGEGDTNFSFEYDNFFRIPISIFKRILKNSYGSLEFQTNGEIKIISELGEYDGKNHFKGKFEFENPELKPETEQEVKVKISRDYIDVLISELDKEEKKEDIEIYIKSDSPALFKVKDKWLLIAPRVEVEK